MVVHQSVHGCLYVVALSARCGKMVAHQHKEKPMKRKKQERIQCQLRLDAKSHKMVADAAREKSISLNEMLNRIVAGYLSTVSGGENENA